MLRFFKVEDRTLKRHTSAFTTMICWRCQSNSVNTESHLPICADVKTRKRRNVVGIDMIRINRIVKKHFVPYQQHISYSTTDKNISIVFWLIKNSGTSLIVVLHLKVTMKSSMMNRGRHGRDLYIEMKVIYYICLFEMFIIDGLVGLWFQLHFKQYFSYISDTCLN
jgi:hypothetical protein